MSSSNKQIESNQREIMNSDMSTEVNLTEDAKAKFRFYKEVLHGFEAYRKCIENHDSITDEGRMRTLSEIQKLIKTFTDTLNYVAAHPDIFNRKLPSVGPVFICGLPRTGTTLLYNLLDCDPNCRAPSHLDISSNVVPPLARSDQEARKERRNKIISSVKITQKSADCRRQLASAHPFLPIEEDYLILRHASYLVFFTHVVVDDEYQSNNWLQNEISKDYVYDYHKIFLQMLDSVDSPSSHWLLKSPIHSFGFDTILQHYPNARFIITHRNLNQTLPSLCSLSWLLAQEVFNENDAVNRQRIVNQCRLFADQIIRSIIEFHTAQQQNTNSAQKCYMNITYDDLMKDPIATVRSIYNYFDLKWSDEFENDMQKWLEDNPQGKQGRHSYSLEEWGLNHKEIEETCSTYTKLFLSQ